ncbi:HalOD1 output domain-containing protein [Natronorubrum sulfidifaciens]|uniref:Halobacterial output domain-containing protein n=1 Tax=Natronorubrum sulfidifaciens JCM 14089 TaxID=1230460 RepID=L9WG83_9EURY|nr:HalOD1 output domain-containing protein [Natronorubrum sulfidifaciens]ELY47338.1 hypothetical protein C495_03732 [Natronorubrum sulfidifaciens JCM 14089]
MEYQTDSDEPTATAVVQAVADYKGVQHEEMEPIYEFIEPDALDSLVSADSDVVVQFKYAGVVVTVGPNQIRLGNKGDTMERLSEDS